MSVFVFADVAPSPVMYGLLAAPVVALALVVLAVVGLALVVAKRFGRKPLVVVTGALSCVAVLLGIVLAVRATAQDLKVRARPVPGVLPEVDHSVGSDVTLPQTIFCYEVDGKWFAHLDVKANASDDAREELRTRLFDNTVWFSSSDDMWHTDSEPPKNAVYYSDKASAKPEHFGIIVAQAYGKGIVATGWAKPRVIQTTGFDVQIDKTAKKGFFSNPRGENRQNTLVLNAAITNQTTEPRAFVPQLLTATCGSETLRFHLPDSKLRQHQILEPTDHIEGSILVALPADRQFCKDGEAEIRYAGDVVQTVTF